MPAPLALAAVPATAALLAYASARLSLPNDIFLIRGMLTNVALTARRERAHRLNPFYDLESWASLDSHADKPLLIFLENSTPSSSSSSSSSIARTWTYAQFYDAVLRYGSWLVSELGVRPRQTVAICFPNNDLFVLVWLALWSVGAVPAFVNNLFAGPGLAHCIRVSTARLCLVDPQLASKVRAAVTDNDDVKHVQIVDLDAQTQATALATPATRAPDHVRRVRNKSDPAVLIYTSGTTGLPKAVIVTWQKINMASLVINYTTSRRPDDVMFTAMPLYHSSGSIGGFTSSLIAGGTLALAARFSRTTFWREVRDTNATMVLYIGEAVRYLLSEASYASDSGSDSPFPHRVRVFVGAGLRADVWRAFVDRFGIDTICEFYGATEGILTTWNVSRNQFSEGAIGRAGTLLRTLLYNRASTIVAMDWDTGEPLRDPATGLCVPVRTGETGEMLFRLGGVSRFSASPPSTASFSDDNNNNSNSNNDSSDSNNDPLLFRGYFNNLTANRAKIIRSVRSPNDAWFRTGDALRWDTDGRLFFADRLGDSFRWKGENVSTTEVGNVMGRHPDVLEANVYGVALPRHDGRAGCASVVFRHASSSSSDSGAPGPETLRSLAAHLKAELPRYAVPLFLRIARRAGDAQNTTGTHKQQKVALRSAGVDPARADPSKAPIYWLRGDTYVPFGPDDWSGMQHGGVRL